MLTNDVMPDRSILRILCQLRCRFVSLGSCTCILGFVPLVAFVPSSSLRLVLTVRLAIAAGFHAEAAVVVRDAEVGVVHLLRSAANLRCRICWA